MLSKRLPCWLISGFLAVVSIPNTLLMSVLNSSSSKIVLIASSLIGLRLSLSISISNGTSVLIVARYFERIICSLFSSTFLLTAPFSLSVFSKRFSMLPNSCSNLSAVLGPTPGHPGMLSDASPINPNRSIICVGLVRLYFSITFLSSNISTSLPLCLGLYMKICSSVSCA